MPAPSAAPSASTTADLAAQDVIQPNAEQWALLQPMERFWYRVTDTWIRRAPWLRIAWNSMFMVPFVWFCVGRRLHIRGTEHLKHLDPSNQVIIVANHRCFFDFFVICANAFSRSHMSRRVLFPVRAPFFYDHVLGGFLNALISGMSMFPPVLRDRKRLAFNRFAVARCISELRRYGGILGIHPEGGRNKGPDPYCFLRAQPGVGKIVLESPHAFVLPVFILGISNNLWAEIVLNWTRPAEHPVDLWFGPEVDFGDLRTQSIRPTTQKRASDMCMDAVGQIAQLQRALREQAEA